MKPIKIREWDFGGGVRTPGWIYFGYIDGRWQGTVFATPHKSQGQYTLYNSKKGTEVYEGDIVSLKNRPDLHCLVYFEEMDFSYRLAVRGDKQIDKTRALRFMDEVIGNIYENSELLES